MKFTMQQIHKPNAQVKSQPNTTQFCQTLLPWIQLQIRSKCQLKIDKKSVANNPHVCKILNPRIQLESRSKCQLKVDKNSEANNAHICETLQPRIQLQSRSKCQLDIEKIQWPTSLLFADFQSTVFNFTANKNVDWRLIEVSIPTALVVCKP